MTAQYGPVQVPHPPVPRRKAMKPRKSPLVKAVEGCATEPGTWFRVATYDNPASAYSARRRMEERKWDWPVAFVVRPAGDDDDRRALYVKVLRIGGGNGTGPGAGAGQ